MKIFPLGVSSSWCVVPIDIKPHSILTIHGIFSEDVLAEQTLCRLASIAAISFLVDCHSWMFLLSSSTFKSIRSLVLVLLSILKSSISRRWALASIRHKSRSLSVLSRATIPKTWLKKVTSTSLTAFCTSSVQGVRCIAHSKRGCTNALYICIHLCMLSPFLNTTSVRSSYTAPLEFL